MTTSTSLRILISYFPFFLACGVASAQGLSPRAYVITPIHSNAITLTYSYQSGDVVLDPSLPIANANGTTSLEILSYFHTFSFFGRSANVNASLPYSSSHLEATASGIEGKAYRSGLAPAAMRFSVNLKGGPAMTVREFAEWKQRSVIGASFTIAPVTGQYDPSRLINIATNRWFFKPEIGFSRRWQSWVLDAYAACSFFTANRNFFSHASASTGPNTQTELPIGAIEMHLSYDMKSRLWISIDGNYWYGGRTSLNGVANSTSLQANSRLGLTAAVRITKHQALKFSYSGGTHVRFGGDYQNLSVAWQYSWFGRPN
jgi:hypothetical protein